MDSTELAQRIAEFSLEKKATDVVILNLMPLTSMTDYFVICTGDSNTQVRAITEHIVDELKRQKNRPLHVEGLANQEWVLIDYVDVVVHVFLPHKRDFYALERLWGDAARSEVIDE